MPLTPAQDGVHAMVPRERMCASARKLRDAYAITPGAPLFRREFGYYCLEEWQAQGMPQDVPWAELFDYDPPGSHGLEDVGWTTAAFSPLFEEKVLEDRGDYELVQDAAGRQVLCFKGRRDGFIPEYVADPVTDRRSWEENVRWRLDPSTPARFATLSRRMQDAVEAAATGKMVSQGLIGGYMYLRSLTGPLRLPFLFYDDPGLIHDCMRTWFELADTVIARHQEHVTLDELFLAEDVCYNHGLLLSPDMMREFLIPYYQELIGRVKRRQIDRSRHLYVQVDTDGFADAAIPLYRREIGMDVMSPFEAAAGCDVVRTGREYPDLALSGGIDKRVLAQGTRDIDDYLERVLPAMRARGGYIPTCDHGVPAEVPYANYLHYRRRCVELGG